jgi:hypothetical protein
MDRYEPSCDFTTRIMAQIRSYEAAIREKESANAAILSQPALMALSAGSVLLGIWNLVRIAWVLIAPTACL